MTASQLRNAQYVVVGCVAGRWYCAVDFGRKVWIAHLAVLLEHCDRYGITVVPDWTVKKTVLSSRSWLVARDAVGNGHHEGA